MLDALSDRFNAAFRGLSGRGRISEANVREAMQEVRTALLEADVHLDVVKSFCKDVIDDAVGSEVIQSLKPGQQMIEIVNRRLVDLMGPVDSHLMLVEPGPTVFMMCGLQGSGKTTTCGKLAALLKKRGKRVLVVAADLQRPAAVEQLRITVEGVEASAPGSGEVAFHGEPEKCAEYGKAVGAAVGVCRRGVERGRKEKYDAVILDTAGRLHVNDELMKELEAVNKTLTPHQVLLIVDAMTGQDAVNSAKAFHERLAVDGVILTKFDSDTRGGAAISVKHVTGAPIKFIGIGEKFDALEEFHPERIAGRILGMGDVVSLVEKARDEVDEAEAEKMAEKLSKGQLDMNDFLKQMRTLRRMGPMKQLLGMLPGVGSALKNVDIDDAQFDRLEGMVNSMTASEREDVKLLGKSRNRRIARGSGTQPNEVGRLVKQFEMVQKMTQQVSGMGMKGKLSAAREMAGAGGMPGMGGMPGLGGKGSTKTLGVKQGYKQRKKGKRR
ncbi:MAG: signal recognition particle protein [Phycisphaerales bacterium]|nr:signal recognition particle protein [Phycisphaerales bacterium]MDG1977756.1 signal recognition particle protein [Phycisphaerales bacterium]